MSVLLRIAIPNNWVEIHFRCDLSVCFGAQTTDSTNGAKVNYGFRVIFKCNFDGFGCLLINRFYSLVKMGQYKTV